MTRIAGLLGLALAALLLLSVQDQPLLLKQAQAESGWLIQQGEVWRYLKGTTEPPISWLHLGFDDSAWLTGPTGIGYGDGDDATVLDDMSGNYASLYLRKQFSAPALFSISKLYLRIDYDDGFVAYVNGVEVARRGLGSPETPVPYDTLAEDHEAGEPETIDISSFIRILDMQGNIFAIQVHNSALESSDLSIIPELYWEDSQEDHSDVLLLYDGTVDTAFNRNVRRISEYYGLKWSSLNLRAEALTSSRLKDEGGAFYAAIAIDAAALSWLDTEELSLLTETVNLNGVNLFLGDLHESTTPAVSELTAGEITGAGKPVDNDKDFRFSTSLPEFTREFSGQNLMEIGSGAQVDYALVFGQSHDHVTALIESTDDAQASYPILAFYQTGAGHIFMQGRNGLKSIQPGVNYMVDLYRPDTLTEILPLMMFLRYSLGEETWHRDVDYANFTIDDPPLECDQVEPCRHYDLDWAGLVPHMQDHEFHTTIAFIPINYTHSMTEVVSIFNAYPDLYSLAIHGNNHDSGLLYPYDCPEFNPQVPVNWQEADLLEARQRMDQHFLTTGIPYANVMIFPCSIAGLQTFTLLKKYNYNLTINFQDLPIDASYSTAWDRGMYPAQMEYRAFPNVVRTEIDNGEFLPYITSGDYLFELFREKPVLLYTHVHDPEYFFDTGMGDFDSYADEINSLEGDVRWASLDYLSKHLYLEKLNDDASYQVMMYVNDLILENPSDSSRTYHVVRQEDFFLSFRVLVDGLETPYTRAKSSFQVDVVIPAHSSKEIVIQYDGWSNPVYLPRVEK